MSLVNISGRGIKQNGNVMYITHQSLYYYTKLASVCVIFVAYCGMVNLLTISSNLNIYVNIYTHV